MWSTAVFKALPTETVDSDRSIEGGVRWTDAFKVFIGDESRPADDDVWVGKVPIGRRSSGSTIDDSSMEMGFISPGDRLPHHTALLQSFFIYDSPSDPVVYWLLFKWMMQLRQPLVRVNVWFNGAWPEVCDGSNGNRHGKRDEIVEPLSKHHEWEEQAGWLLTGSPTSEIKFSGANGVRDILFSLFSWP